jgi:O-antigen/teichoic acid export membrane protein
MALSLDAMPGYAVSVRLVEGVLLLVAPLANVVISYLRESDANQFAAARQRVLGSAFALWSLGCVLWAAGWAGGNVIIPFVFGADYAGSERWLVWASLPLPWMMANLVLLQAAFARTELRLIVGRVGFCAVFFLIACFILMRLIGASGVGLGAALSQALLSAFLFECILGARKRRAGAQS